MEQVAESLDKLKADLVRITANCQYTKAALSVFTLQSMFLYLHARRMGTFIRNSRLLGVIENVCFQLDYAISTQDPLTGRTALVSPTESLRSLQNINLQLMMDFRIHQRDNIEDFLAHLKAYFQPSMKQTLQKKLWLVCEQGRW